MEGSNLKFLWAPDIAHKYSLRVLEKKVGVEGRKEEGLEFQNQMILQVCMKSFAVPSCRVRGCGAGIRIRKPMMRKTVVLLGSSLIQQQEWEGRSRL